MSKQLTLKLEGRVKWIDIARGIAILLVMIGHLNFSLNSVANLTNASNATNMEIGLTPFSVYIQGANITTVLMTLISNIISIFHMPLFFFLSGITFNPNISFKEFLKKKFYELLLPYFALSIITVIPYIICALQSIEYPLNFRFLLGIIYGRCTPIKGVFDNEINLALRVSENAEWNSLWFLPALFVMELLLYFFLSLCKSLKNKKSYIYMQRLWQGV